MIKTMQDSVFTKIIKGEIPAHKIYEDEKTLAFLPLDMAPKGHVLVVSKTQVDEFQDLADDDYQALMATVKKVAERMKAVLGTKRIGLKVIGLDVPHAHVHIIGFDTLEDYNHHTDDSRVAPDEAARAAMAERLRFND
jgi:histidine triad (HIT) family protein